MAEEKKLNMVITLSVEGEEGLEFNLAYKNTTMSTVLLVEQALVTKLGELIAQQIAGKI